MKANEDRLIPSEHIKASHRPVLGEAIAEDIRNPYHIAIPREMYFEILDLYEPLKANKAYRKFFEYLFLRPTYRDPDTGYILMPYYVLAEIEGKARQARSRNYNGTQFMQRFSEDTGITIACSDWLWRNEYGKKQYNGKIPKYRRYRRITHVGIDEKLLARMLHMGNEKSTLVYWQTGKTRSLQTVIDDYNRTFEWLRSQGKFDYKNEDQRMIADMLHATPVSKFYHMVNNKRQVAYERLEALPEKCGHRFTHSDGKHNQRTILALVWARPKPIYGIVSHSERLFSSGLTTVDSRLREVLVPELDELDLRHAHGSIACVQWDIPELYNMLAGGKSIWTYLMDYLEIEPYHRKVAKDEIKPAFYSCLYGGSLYKIEERLVKGLVKEEHIPYKWGSLTHNWLIGKIFKARDREIARIKREKGTMTPYRWIPLSEDLRETEEQTVRSHLSHANSAFELWLIAACFEAVDQRTDKDATIMLLQHDGISVDIRPGRRDRVLKAMAEAVDARAKEYGFPTGLEVKIVGNKDRREKDAAA